MIVFLPGSMDEAGMRSKNAEERCKHNLEEGQEFPGSPYIKEALIWDGAHYRCPICGKVRVVAEGKVLWL